MPVDPNSMVIAISSSVSRDFNSSGVDSVASAIEKDFNASIVAIITHDRKSLELIPIINEEHLDDDQFDTMVSLVDDYFLWTNYKIFSSLLYMEELANALVTIDMDRPTMGRIGLYYGIDHIIKS